MKAWRDAKFESIVDQLGDRALDHALVSQVKSKKDGQHLVDQITTEETSRSELLKEIQQTMLMELTPATRKHTVETFICDLPTSKIVEARAVQP